MRKNPPNFTGAVNKLKTHFARKGRIPGMTITGTLQTAYDNTEFAEVYIDGAQRWVALNGRGPLVLRTQL